MNDLRATALAALFFALSACGGHHDTCTGGSNMTNIRLADTTLAETASGHAWLGIRWDVGTGPGAELPDAYFDAVSLENPPPTVVAAEKYEERAIRIEFSESASSLVATEPLEVRLRFPDRAHYIDCTHPGMEDVYYLVASFVFPGDETIQSPTFWEMADLGDI